MPDEIACKWRTNSGDRFDCNYPREIEVTKPMPSAFVLQLIVNRCDEPHECSVREEN